MTKSSVLYITLALLLGYTNVQAQETKILLQKNANNAFGIEASIKPSDSSKKLQKIPMLVSLDSSDSFISKGCSGFKAAGLNSLQIEPKSGSDSNHLDYYTFKANGFTSKAGITISNNWATDSVPVANSCDNKQNFGNIQGVLGLGYRGNSANNFKSNPKTFAFEFSDDHRTGLLVFNPDTKKTGKGGFVNSFKADEDWHLNGDVKLVIDGKSDDKGEMSVIFDVNFDTGFGLPPAIFDELERAISKSGLTLVRSDYLKIQGNWADAKDKLPKVGLQIGEHILNIELSQMLKDLDYKYDRKNDKWEEMLEFNIHNTKYAKEVKRGEYVGYSEKYIVLGNAFLNKYYSIFDVSKKEVTIHAPEAFLVPHRGAVEAEISKKRDEFQAEQQQEAKEEKEEKQKSKEDKEFYEYFWKFSGSLFFICMIGGGVAAVYLLWQRRKASKLEKSLLNDKQSLQVELGA